MAVYTDINLRIQRADCHQRWPSTRVTRILTEGRAIPAMHTGTHVPPVQRIYPRLGHFQFDKFGRFSQTTALDLSMVQNRLRTDTYLMT